MIKLAKEVPWGRTATIRSGKSHLFSIDALHIDSFGLGGAQSIFGSVPKPYNDKEATVEDVDSDLH